MANATHNETARIYQFPIGARTGRRSQPAEAKIVVLERKSSIVADAAYGSGWYHDAAIEADHKPKA
jgi:hypothetical protein